jgi:Protein of unknown function (DUF2786)
MGTNNRQRRAAKRRKRRNHNSPRSTSWFGPPAGAKEYGGNRADQYTQAMTIIRSVLLEISVDQARAADYSQLFLGPEAPVPGPVMIQAIDDYASAAIGAAVRAGWLPSDLAELTSRRMSAQHLPTLAALLTVEAGRHPAEHVAAPWWDDLAGLGPAAALDPLTVATLELLLELLAIIRTLLPIPILIPAPGLATGVRGPSAGIEPKVLSRVRSLLAKAESTEFPKEAEALSAKAQELISRYALDRLTLMQDAADDHELTTSRMWIDPPYLLAKAMLIGAVASANRCRSVLTREFGFSIIVGEAADIEAVELLSTSLLVQASGAMLGHGSLVDRWGTSRTRSFRQSFLVSYGVRIGGKRHATTEKAAADTGRSGQLVPLLRRRAERVDAAMDAMFPELISRGPSVSNEFGWTAGRAAADLAQLDVRAKVASSVA